MLNTCQKLLSRDSGKSIRDVVFFIGLYFYLWLGVDLCLIYYGVGTVANFPTFFRDWGFLRDHLSYPGGLIEYISAFLAQFFYYSWAGAIVATLQVWLISVCTEYILKAIGASRLRWVRFVPAILLLATYIRYTYYFDSAAALLVALFFVCLYLRTALKDSLFNSAVYVFLSAIVYTIAGGAYLLFAVLCVIYELFLRRRRAMGAAYVLLSLVVIYVEGIVLFGVSMGDAFANLLPVSWKILGTENPFETVVMVCIVYGLVPAVLLAVGLSRMAGLRSKTKLVKQKGKGRRKAHRTSGGAVQKLRIWYSATPVRRWCVGTSLLLVVAGASVFVFHDSERKALFELDYYTYRGLWPEVLQRAQYSPNNYVMIYAVNMALYHTGRLGDEMFRHHQSTHTLFLTSEEVLEAWWKRFGVFFELGCINSAEHALIESLGSNTERPVILKRLALVNMVKGDIDTAGVYLRALSKTLFDADWAHNYLSRLKSDSVLSTDQVIQQTRELIVEQDDIWQFSENETLLLDLLERNRRNKMAFEYLMAWFLLTRQLDKFVENIGRLDDFKYTRIPRHYEEAILLYSYARRRRVDLHGRQISSESRQSFSEFNRILSFYDSNTQAAYNHLARKYGNSYYFYHVYELSGMKK